MEMKFVGRAVAAGNSIMRGQYANGAFSTWGRDRRFGHTLNSWDWPGCNAVASSALMILQAYGHSAGPKVRSILARHRL
jgi:hypothetical protein